MLSGMDDVTTLAVRPLFDIGKRRVLVKTLRLPGVVSQSELPDGYVLPNGALIKESRWGGAKVKPILFGVGLATALSS
jgi:hypothetical protein